MADDRNYDSKKLGWKIVLEQFTGEIFFQTASQ